MTPVVSILIPSRGRLELLSTCVRSWKETASNPDGVEIIVRLHLDDLESLEWAIERPYDIHVIAGENMESHLSMGLFANCMAACSTGDWLMPSSDDFLCVTKGWDKVLQKVTGNPRNEYLIRHFDTTKEGERPPIITRGLYHAIGCFGHTSHADVYVDSLGWELGINRMEPLPVKVINRMAPPPPPGTWELGYARYLSDEVQTLLRNDVRKVKMLMEKPTQ